MKGRRVLSWLMPLFVIILAFECYWFWSHHQQGMRRQIPSDLPSDVKQQVETLYGPAGEAMTAAKDFGRLGDSAKLAIPFLIHMLGDHSLTGNDRPIERGIIAGHALAAIGPPSVDPLIAVMSGKDWRVRRNAILALGQIGDSRGVEPIIRALKDGDDTVRSQAARALGQLKDRRAVGPLCERINDPHPGIRENVISALGSIGGDQATDVLISLLKIDRKRNEMERNLEGDPETANRWAAAEALGQPGCLRAVGPLIAALKDRNWYVREHAVRSLGRIGDRKAVDPLIEFLGRADTDTGDHEHFSQEEVTTSLKTATVEALGELGDARAVDPLAGLLKYGDEYFRRSVVDALAKIRDPRVTGLLISALKDPDEFVWSPAANDLGNTGDPVAVEPLIEALRRSPTSYANTTEDVAEALKKITGQDLGLEATKWERWWDGNKTNILSHIRQKIEPVASVPD
jgi:HEAT repeat protein